MSKNTGNQFFQLLEHVFKYNNMKNMFVNVVLTNVHFPLASEHELTKRVIIGKHLQLD